MICDSSILIKTVGYMRDLWPTPVCPPYKSGHGPNSIPAGVAMKWRACGELPATAPWLLKLASVLAVSLSFFYVGKRWSDSGAYGQLLFFSRSTPLPSVALSPNSNLSSFNVSALTHDHSDPSPPDPPAAAEATKVRFGIVDENGTMREDFEVGEFDPDLAESLGGENGTVGGGGGDWWGSPAKVVWGRFPLCAESMSEYIPCLDNAEAIGALNSTERGERFERHCPRKGWDCVVPAPKDYRKPIPWPKSRDEV